MKIFFIFVLDDEVEFFLESYILRLCGLWNYLSL
jgi:hypothetical protein